MYWGPTNHAEPVWSLAPLAPVQDPATPGLQPGEGQIPQSGVEVSNKDNPAASATTGNSGGKVLPPAIPKRGRGKRGMDKDKQYVQAPPTQSHNESAGVSEEHEESDSWTLMLSCVPKDIGSCLSNHSSTP